MAEPSLENRVSMSDEPGLNAQRLTLLRGRKKMLDRQTNEPPPLPRRTSRNSPFFRNVDVGRAIPRHGPPPTLLLLLLKQHVLLLQLSFRCSLVLHHFSKKLKGGVDTLTKGVVLVVVGRGVPIDLLVVLELV